MFRGDAADAFAAPIPPPVRALGASSAPAPKTSASNAQPGVGEIRLRVSKDLESTETSFDKQMVDARARMIGAAKNVRFIWFFEQVIKIAVLVVWCTIMLIAHGWRALPAFLAIYILSYVVIGLGDAVIVADQAAFFAIIQPINNFVNGLHNSIIGFLVPALNWQTQEWYQVMQEIATTCMSVTNPVTIFVGLLSAYTTPTTVCPVARIMAATPELAPVSSALFTAWVVRFTPGPQSCTVDEGMLVCYWIRIGYVILFIGTLLLLMVVLIAYERVLFAVASLVTQLIELPYRVYLWLKYAGRADHLAQAHKLLEEAHSMLVDGDEQQSLFGNALSPYSWAATAHGVHGADSSEPVVKEPVEAVSSSD